MNTKIGMSLAAGCLIVSAVACSKIANRGSYGESKKPSYDVLMTADSSHDWLTYSGSYSGQRFSKLAQINTGNVGSLKPTWIYQSQEQGKMEATPIVSRGVMYITEWTGGQVAAVDVKTGRPLWTYTRPVAEEATGCCGKVNRGAAILDDTLFVITFDAHLVALDARSGALKWDRVVADYKQGFSMTGAPLVAKDKVIVGIGGADMGVRGFLDAYDAKTGKQAWRFWTVPAPGLPGSETWPKTNTWKRGGGSTWMTGSFDPHLNLVFWGIGNPGPSLFGDERKGDNLYTNCLVALDLDTGKLKWHFQFTPHDTHDWDAVQIPVLATLKLDGSDRDVVLTANRNGFYYVLDRTTGKFLTGRSFVKQTWAKGLDPDGRPIVVAGMEPSREGTITFPSMEGGTSWMSPSFSPEMGLFYVTAYDRGAIFYKFAIDQETPALSRFEGGNNRRVPGLPESYAVKALEAGTGKLVWEFDLVKPTQAGLLSTSGGLVFGGTQEGYFFALDAKSGKPLWKFNTGGKVVSSPITYMHEGKQYVAISAYRSLVVFSLQ